MLPVQDFNAYDLLRNKMLVLTLPALEKALELFGEAALGTKKTEETAKV